MQNLLTTAVLAFSMSADAFAATLGKGAALDRPRLSEALRTGFIFGIIEAITPLVGWAAGLAASSYITAIDHWIAFALLTALGAKMIWESVRHRDAPQKPNRHSLRVLVATAIGTSIDAMAVGVTLAFIDADIVATVLAIGCATFLMATAGVLIGRHRRKIWAHCRGDWRNRADRDWNENSRRTHASQLTSTCFAAQYNRLGHGELPAGELVIRTRRWLHA
jgi:putative Mn2+ efflux pump MntP